MNKLISMKGKITSILIIICLIISSIFFVIPASASISSITTKSGVVNALINFTSSNDHVYRIYYGESSGITTNDNQTYDYGYNNGEGNVSYASSSFGYGQRHILIRGLIEDTTYYYKIYDVDSSNWAIATEYSFTTNPRFTTQWVDDFFDDYLIEQNNSISIVQNVGEKHGSAIINVGSGGYSHGWHNADIFYEDGVWRIFATGTSTGHLNRYYMESTNGLTWTTPSSLSVSLLGRVCGANINDSGTWRFIYSAPPEHLFGVTASATSATDGNGAYIQINPKIVTGPPNNGLAAYGISSLSGFFKFAVGMTDDEAEAVPTGIIYDTLGATKYIGMGQTKHGEHTDTPASYRAAGYFIGVNDTCWMMYDEHSWNYSIDGFYIDDNTPLGTANSQHYNQSYFCTPQIISGTYIAMVEILNESSGWGDSAHDNLLRPFLVTSRNGYNDWKRSSDEAILNPVKGGSSWDDGLVKTFWANPILTVGEHDYIYYIQANTYHGNLAHGNSVITRAVYRKNGVTSLVPTNSDAWFRTISIPSKFVSNFTVNGNFSETNKLNISVINTTTGSVYSGFDFSDFDTITTNSLNIEPTWNGINISHIPNGNFKLNFSFDGSDGKLFLYSLDEGFHTSSQCTFQYINDITNNSVTYEPISRFNWTRDNDAVYYQLQIANDSDFTDIWVYLSDINASNYPVHYSETLYYVEFILPEGYRKNVYQNYYMRIRSGYL